MRERSISGGGNKKCKGPEMGIDVACAMNNWKARRL